MAGPSRDSVAAWRHTIVPVGFVGWKRLPSKALAGKSQFRSIGSAMDAGVLDASCQVPLPEP